MSQWLHQAMPAERRTFEVYLGGWSLDAHDVQMFGLLIPRSPFQFDTAAEDQQLTTIGMVHPSGERDA